MIKSNFHFAFTIFIVVVQNYEVDASKEYVIRGNAGILKCQLPSFVADYLNVVAWHTDDNESYSATNQNYG